MSYLFYLLIFYLVFFSGCIEKISDEEIEKLTIVNNSEHLIGFCISYNYPDTSLNNTSDRGCSEISPRSSCEAGTHYGWKSDIQRNKHGVIIFFISDNDTVEKYGPEIWRKEYKILKRYEKTQADMEANNWTITYP